MKVSYDEGVAIHIGPESCAVAREGFGEALTGGAHRPAIEPRKIPILGADAVHLAEGHTRPPPNGAHAWGIPYP